MFSISKLSIEVESSLLQSLVILQSLVFSELSLCSHSSIQRQAYSTWNSCCGLFILRNIWLDFSESSDNRRKTQTSSKRSFSTKSTTQEMVEFKTNMCDVCDTFCSCETRITIIYDILLYDVVVICGTKKKWKLLNRLNFMLCISLWLKISFFVASFEDMEGVANIER